MISVEMEDVLAVLQLCKPYIIGMIAAVIIGIGVMIACRKMSRGRRFFVRGNAVIAMLLVIIVCVNMICFGPMSTLIGLATGNGTVSDATNEESARTAEEIMEEGIVLLENEGMLPLSGTQKLNLFGWEAVNPAYGGAGSGGINDLYEIVSLVQGLQNAGFTVNQELLDFYDSYGQTGNVDSEAELDASGTAGFCLSGGTDSGCKGIFRCGGHCDFQEGRRRP